MPLATNSRLGPYEIKSAIGAGGMGEVYRAHDSRLNRDVALKVLRADATATPELKARFEREARAIAALNHPNIVAVFDFGTEPGLDAEGNVQYIASELIDGESLREVIAGKPVSIRKLIDIAVQTADGLAAAHAAGIVHRDLKPENIMLAKDGRVKILDFGLARQSTKPVPTAKGSEETLTLRAGSSSHLTNAGAIFGTASYMSPEQAQGKETDYHSDQFSFALVLHEMASGKQAFARSSSVETMAAIIHDEPPPIEEKLPAPLKWIIDRCLSKEPQQRYDSTRDLYQELRNLRDHFSEAFSSIGSMVAVPAKAQHGRWGRLVKGMAITIAVTSIFVAALILGIWLLLPAPQPRVLKSTPLTNDGKTKCCLVTDGSRIYFSENYLGTTAPIQHIPVTGGNPTGMPVPSLEGYLFITDISRDYDRLLVATSVTGTEGTLWSVPLAASSPRPLTDQRAAIDLRGAKWSPDGRRLVYTNGFALYLAQSDGSESKRLVTAKGTVSNPAWSPDGKSVRFAATDSSTIGASTLFEVSAEGGDFHEVTPHWQNKSSECFGDWTPDGKYYLFLTGCNGRANIWAIREKGPFLMGRKREPVPLTAGPISYGPFAFSPDGKKIFVQGIEHRAEAERYDRKSAQFAPVRPTLSADCCVYSNDGQWMAYVTYPEQSLWRSKPDGSQSQQLTWPPMQALNPHWSPDGREIAFSAPSPGKSWKTFIIPAQGGSARELTQGECPELDANWSPDGTHLTYGAFPGYVPDASCPAVLYTMDLKTHEISAVPGSEGLFSPRWSPDGKTIVALNVALSGLMIGDIASRKWSPLVEPLAGSATGYPQWSSDGSLVYYYRSFQTENAMYSVRVKDHKTEKIADLSGMQTIGTTGTWAAFAPDGSPLILRDLSLNEIYALDFDAP